MEEKHLFVLQLHDPRLDAVLDHQASHSDWPLLAKTMDSIDRLVLDGWVPPRIHDETVARLRQIQGNAAGLEGDQEDRHLRIRHELVDRGRPLMIICCVSLVLSSLFVLWLGVTQSGEVK